MVDKFKFNIKNINFYKLKIAKEYFFIISINSSNKGNSEEFKLAEAEVLGILAELAEDVGKLDLVGELVLDLLIRFQNQRILKFIFFLNVPSAIFLLLCLDKVITFLSVDVLLILRPPLSLLSVELPFLEWGIIRRKAKRLLC